MWRRVLGVIIGLTSAVGGMCHAYLQTPAARNVQHNSDYCPQCLNGPELCGDPRGQHNHEAFGRYATPPHIARTYRSGGVLSARVVIMANHAGRWGLQLCALDDPSPESERRASKRCFRKLRLARGRGSYVYVSPSDSTSAGKFRLPRGTRCKRCVLRWVYETGNSCTPPGTPARYALPGLDVCGKWMDGERFTNCADITVV